MKSLLLLLSLLSTAAAFAPPRYPARLARKSPLDATAIIAGATGYIGKSVVQESVQQGYKTYALVRDVAKTKATPALAEFLVGATLIECNVTDAPSLNKILQEITDTEGAPVDTIVSCLASRSGIKKDAYLIDYQATLNCLEAGRAAGSKHFTLLSAFCVRNPWLQFQLAKLDFEAALQKQDDMSWSIVRPTAYFKSVSGQLEVVQNGAPYVMFGDGQITQCNPIAESELAEYMMDCAKMEERKNKILNLGGPDIPLTNRMQGEMMFRATGMEPQFFSAPIWIFDAFINGFQFLADLTSSQGLEDAAETARIGKYYAVESMLTEGPDEKYGTITLQQHYNKIAVEGQEYDPYVTMFAKLRLGDLKGIRDAQQGMKDAARQQQDLMEANRVA